MPAFEKRSLTVRERKLLRYGGLGLAGYLVLFFGFKSWTHLERQRADYRQMVRDAVGLKQRLEVYQEKAQSAHSLMEQFRLDPGKLSRTTIVAQASAAIQQSALGGGIELGPIRETPSNATAQELTAMQLEGVGPVPAILGFLQSLGRLGFPVVTDSVQLTPEASQPGRLKLNVTIVILDFDRWTTNQVRPDV